MGRMGTLYVLHFLLSRHFRFFGAIEKMNFFQAQHAVGVALIVA